MSGKRPYRGLLTCLRFVPCLSLVCGIKLASGSVVVDFEDLALPEDSYYNGSDGAGGFTSGGAFFDNTFTDYGGGIVAWSGWSGSSMTDNTTPGFDNQYSAITGRGLDGSSVYAVAYASDWDDAAIELPASAVPQSFFVTNTTYAYFSMLQGDAFAKRFGGTTGDDPDYLLLTISGLNDDDEQVGTVDFYLADYRFSDNAQDYIVNTWTEVDLTSLSNATCLTFRFDSSDVDPYGIRTPTYFAADNLTLVPEPSTAVLAVLAAGGMLCRRSNHLPGRQRNVGQS